MIGNKDINYANSSDQIDKFMGEGSNKENNE